MPRSLALIPVLRCHLPLTAALALALPALLSGAGRAQQGGEPQVRVLLLEGASANVNGGATGLRLRDGRGTVLAETGAGQSLSLRLSAFQVETQGLSRDLRVNELWIEPIAEAGGDGALAVQNRRYRGRLQVLPGGSQLQLINHLGIETYLPSVVGSEMPASWPQEALRAQAVAARTYALQQRKPLAPFDLRATVASQAYKGMEAETPSTWEAVRGTRSLVITFQRALVNAVFHSSSGGSTENSGELWSRQLPYLVSVPDFDDQSPVRTWRQVLAPEQLQRTFAEIGGAQRIEVLSSTSTGRVRQARVVGPRGQLLLSGAELRSRLGLKSTTVRFEPLGPGSLAEEPQGLMALGGPPVSRWSLARARRLWRPDPVDPAPAAPVDSATGEALPGPLPLPVIPSPVPPAATALVAIGRGFGHGVGMSQWGAYGLARRGEGFEAILRHFYRGVEVGPFRESVAQLSGPPASVSSVAPVRSSAAAGSTPFRIPTVIAYRER
ncbi:SpoIID/LytB domain-containing protein [Cyanobium sp. Morenito 9A2]|uniref:SpoIID/LytB domain-containing protein n=1 Tax=Cyanobium sp. Morenito 9A2 TaxID=2823718 RepID=UPI0020CC2328|nr:SpoIID/LytB domain-containing protein [Cyanobium sp. Morenito 9A2]MCP9849099.1 SpoIID/LytB domain-containing protein [Cyanobium sp. Morenito 9A2]